MVPFPPLHLLKGRYFHETAALPTALGHVMDAYFKFSNKKDVLELEKIVQQLRALVALA